MKQRGGEMPDKVRSGRRLSSLARLCWSILILLHLSVIPGAWAADISAFPGAEGHGCTTPGGRGGRVFVVTRLDDRGPGSFREACEAAGPRTVVFAVSGYITLESGIEIRHPFCTIAGQSAPGAGVCVRGWGLTITTHDVVIRHMRFRMGRPADAKITSFRDSVHISGTPPCHHIVIDHCSISWGVSRNLVTWSDAHDITVQWSIISEPLYEAGLSQRAFEGMGFLIGDRTQRISVHHCLFAHNYQRNPRLKHGVRADLVNNVIYNWDDGGAHLIGDFAGSPTAPVVEANIIANWYQAGAATKLDTPTLQALTDARLYLAGNVDNHRLFQQDLGKALDKVTISPTPVGPISVAAMPVREAYQRVLAEAGAVRPKRDAVDARIAREVREGTGHYLRHQDDVGGWPELEPGQPPEDADRDGMADEWERRHELDGRDPADAGADPDGDGYTNIEEYLNRTNPRQAEPLPTSASAQP